MKKKSLYWLMAMILVLSAFLAACGGNDDSATNDEPKDTDKDTEQTDDGDATDAEPAEGGTLVYGLDASPEGLYSSAFYGIATDAEVIALFDEPLIDYNENLEPIPNVASWETEDNKVFNFTFEEGVMWHNGEELTVNDWVFALETIASPDYDGPRYTNVSTIEGAEAFRNGEADTISGIEVVSDYEITITFDQPRVNNLTNLWVYPLPEAAMGETPVAEMSASEWVRSTPVGIGPFKVENIVPGESVEFVKNEDYWNGDVKLDSIILRVIDNSSVVGALQNGDVDMISLQPVSGPEVEPLENVEIVTYPGLSYYYVGFKLGVFDNATQTITEELPKYQDKELRKAMMHALNRQEWVDAFFFGYANVVNAPVPSSHWNSADDSELNTYEYDPEMAMQILDDAGYVDTNGDGYREDPNGDELVVKFSHYATGNPTFESRAQAITQYWDAVGLKSELEMVEVNLYYDMIEKDDPAIETFFGGWGTGADPDPSGLWKADQLWNYPRYNNPEADQLLDDALDIEIVGTDQDKRAELYIEWQKIVNEDLPMLYIAELEEIVALNERVGGIEFDVSGQNNPAEWFVTE
ncbi:oligopeptide ABC transporter substrate-binding protein [Planomicrobium sp. YIM 101495]|uniref:oligopeptide ABC transporter substrate-binding protein n=1 Tax=Planomicrobium sp. YIM 101495 TaxID=2665160 RepID=UPI0012B702B2|nr:oligopeptide ABC transporter substrate-binding protein [Planomicrobium sp. YIM 101495]MTD30460.1 oligopeptide ABC transporter substrate-binding protein [Planomicrobium sp. YIM 101495]